MLKTGSEHLESLRDGRVVYVGSERIDDVTTHPAFRNAARSMAAIYDMKRANPAFSFTEGKQKYSAYFLRAKTKDDLQKRSNLHRAIAAMSHGLLGRSPDHVASFVTGMSMDPSVFGKYGDNLVRYYSRMCKDDLYGVYAVLPPQAARNPEFYVKQNLPVPSLRVVREEDDGLVVSGMKMLATGAVFANEIWIGNLLPLAPTQLAESITCALPVNTKGLTLWSRKPFERYALSEFDNPLTWRFDETDSMVMCEEVKVPWERVFVHMDAILAREIYIKTPGHCYGNHQSNVRFHEKLKLIVGLASKIAHASGANEVPAVREVLGRFSALEAALGGMIAGQLHEAEDWPEGWKTFNRRYMYAALNWCTESHSSIIDSLRELLGGGVFQMPADASVMHDEHLKGLFEKYWQTPQLGAVERMKLYKLAWDLIGSEFAGRHLQYEKFYAGASFIVRNHSFREAPWPEFHRLVDDLMASYDIPQPSKKRKVA
ncbi:MAG TPA: 4-hydroxyphenylacetate 3-hydroxylase N-terminal domain-containing protein [Burkholderiales bacterium]|jgi:4-hydroxyphenylacetate 3-monooxygenase|nr:4-hydroxyphenylacetate 3-hydroxylase N-terminal domain-containing protein [Burkholderiales bacterium]